MIDDIHDSAESGMYVQADWAGFSGRCRDSESRKAFADFASSLVDGSHARQRFRDFEKSKLGDFRSDATAGELSVGSREISLCSLVASREFALRWIVVRPHRKEECPLLECCHRDAALHRPPIHPGNFV